MSLEVTKIESPDDPQRCQGIAAHGQCNNKAVEGGKYCMVHGGKSEQRAQAKEAVRNFQLTILKDRLNRHSSSPAIHSLREEIGILRLVLETKLNSITDDTELMLHSQSIAEMVSKISDTVKSCHKLDIAIGQYLDKNQLNQILEQVISILAEEIEQERLETISRRIAAEIKLS